MGTRNLTSAMLLLACLFQAPLAHSRVQDFANDFDAGPVASDQNETDNAAYNFDSPDPWSSFLPTLSSYNRVTWGIKMQGVSGHEENVSLPMVPASVQKMITSASALRNLGGNARFANSFEALFDSATKTASNVKFTVSGDPTWGHPAYEAFGARMTKLITELKAKGVQTVTGDVTILSTRPELDTYPRPTGWPIRWTLQCMATMPSAFMINGNCGSLKVNSLTSAVWTTPGVDLPIHLNITAGAANNMTIKAEQDSLLRITGYTITGKFKSATAYFHDPLQSSTEVYNSFPVYFGTRWLKNLFIQALAANGIAYVPNGAAVIGSALTVDLSSMTLLSILKVGVPSSINAILDRTFLETAHVLNAAQASDPSYAILREVTGDESLMSGIQIFDGSGLVVDDHLRADTLYAFLTKLKTQSYFQDFLSLLPVAGKPGTLASRLTGPLTLGKVFAKTGTIDNYYNLAGYFSTPSQTLEPFVVLTSSALTASQVRVMIDQVVTEFAGLNTPASRRVVH